MTSLYKDLQCPIEGTQIDFFFSSRYRGIENEKKTTWNPLENVECKFNLYGKSGDGKYRKL